MEQCYHRLEEGNANGTVTQMETSSRALQRLVFGGAVLSLVFIVGLSSSPRVAPQLLVEDTDLDHGVPTAANSVCASLPDVLTTNCTVGKVALGALLGAATGPVAVPVFFGAVACCGFGAAGVAAGSCAAAIQGPVTAAGGCFASMQSCGALGCCGASAAFPPLIILILILAVLGAVLGAALPGVCACDWGHLFFF